MKANRPQFASGQPPMPIDIKGRKAHWFAEHQKEFQNAFVLYACGNKVYEADTRAASLYRRFQSSNSVRCL